MRKWDWIGPECMSRTSFLAGDRAKENRIGWTPNVYNEELFRVFEYGAMSVYVFWSKLDGG